MCSGFEVIGMILLGVLIIFFGIACGVTFVPPLLDHLEDKWKRYLREKFKK